MRDLFEKWLITHFGSHIQSVINQGFDEEDGYIDLSKLNGKPIDFTTNQG